MEELLARVSSRELSEWRAYDTLEPIGERRGDYRAALVASTMANLWRGKNTRAAEIRDFLLEFGQEDEPEMDASGTLAYWQMLTGAR